MSKPPKYWLRAKRILSKKDKVMKKLISNYKDGSLVTRNDVFFSLCKVLLVNKLVLRLQTQFFQDLKKNVKIKLMLEQLINYLLIV